MVQKSQMSLVEKATAFTAIFLIEIGILQVVAGEYIWPSVTLEANGIDCIGDGIISAMVWVGLRYIRSNPHKKFRYRYYEIEKGISIIAALTMTVLAGYIIYRSYLQLLHPTTVQMPLFGAIMAGSAATGAFILGAYKFYSGRKMGIQPLTIDGVNTIKDGITSSFAFSSMVLMHLGFQNLDAITGFILGIIIISIAFSSLKEAREVYTDACDVRCDYQTRLVKAISKDIKGVRSVRHVKVWRASNIANVEIEVDVHGGMSVDELTFLRDEIEEMLRMKIKELGRVVVIPSTIRE